MKRLMGILLALEINSPLFLGAYNAATTDEKTAQNCVSCTLRCSFHTPGTR